MPYVWLVYLPAVPLNAYFLPPTPRLWIMTIDGILCFLVLYFRAYPEFGEEIASLQRQGDQLLVTALRQGGLTGPLQNPRFELMRLKLTAHVSFDGLPPN